MGKKRKNKEDSRLRAQVEFLKAQLKNRPADIPKKAELPKAEYPDTHRLDATLLKTDLKRTLILTIAAAFILVAAFLWQSYGPTAGGN